MKMTVISSNIRFDNPKDESNSWGHRKDLLGRILCGYAPDLLGTQEGRLPQLRELQSLLPRLQLVEEHRNWIEERMYPCIFFNPHTIDPLESGDIWLSETPFIPGSSSFQSAFPRLATWLKGRPKKSNMDFLFVNLHLDHVLPETREKQIEVLITELKRLNPGNLPLILSGDFNEAPTGMVRKILQGHLPNLYDPWIHLNLPERPSHHRFNMDLSNGSRIDWILLDQNLRISNIFFDETCEAHLFPSDHFPLISEIEI